MFISPNFYDISSHYISPSIYTNCHMKDTIKNHLKNIYPLNISNYSYILLSSMIFLLEATVGFPVNLKQASDWDVVNVKQQYHLINILKLSWSSSLTSIKTVHYFQWLFIAICLKLWDKKSKQSSRRSITSIPLSLNKKTTQHFQWHDSTGNEKSYANIN